MIKITALKYVKKLIDVKFNFVFILAYCCSQNFMRQSMCKKFSYLYWQCLFCKLMRIVFSNREWYFLRHFLTSRLRTNVQIARYMISAKDDVRCFVHDLKPTI